MNSILTFDTFYKSVLWGGSRIAAFKGEASKGNDIGESWELSPMPGHESKVADGPYKGTGLNEMIRRFGNDIMGERLMKRCHGSFPLLVKFIDSNDDLSIQVHPDDALAAARHNSLGKTEMWYSIAPREGAGLYSGFSRRITPEEYRQRVADNTIVDVLARHAATEGDVFFLPAGRVHSIARGNFVLEIQEASDVTYRIYDYDRRDASGKPRELHVEQAVDAIDFDDVNAAAPTRPVFDADGTALLARCSYFETSLMKVDGCRTIDLEGRDSFSILISVKGSLRLTGADGQTVELPQGHTALVPASLPRVTAEGCGELVSVFVP